jgi:hypothetical protein
MRNRHLILALIFAGTTGWVGLTRAESPASPAQPGITRLADDKVETPEMQHLRAARKLLNDAKDAFDKDPADKADHRKEILEGIDKAINAVDAEIDEYKTDAK